MECINKLGIEYNCISNGICFNCCGETVECFQDATICYIWNNGEWQETDIGYGEISLYKCYRCGESWED